MAQSARWPGRPASVHRADVTELPFPDRTFDVVVSQHVQTNVADKARLYAGAGRVLTPTAGGLPCGMSRLAITTSSTIPRPGPTVRCAATWSPRRATSGGRVRRLRA
ncbi:methyltransferase domain-containing protein [Mycobacterium sp.]|uniref:class I SAM-dependent methyltransferase n=1 Tax=Mycobacterium sp. TaxID=1785 RepID=UPI0025F70712|nr:methyltransferase domain-containing protein [Mycobacterium sp.]